MRPELIAAIDADEAVGIRASPVIRTEQSLRIKPSRVLFCVVLRSERCIDRRARRGVTTGTPPFLLTKLCLIPPFSP
jgi:hypothetical protein